MVWAAPKAKRSLAYSTKVPSKRARPNWDPVTKPSRGPVPASLRAAGGLPGLGWRRYDSGTNANAGTMAAAAMAPATRKGSV